MRKSKRLLYNRETLKTEILTTPVKDLGLKISSSTLQTCIEKVKEDIAYFGIEFEPRFYLSDSYGCVEGTINIGLGFWDAEPLLREVVKETKGVFRDENDLLLLLKHEIGHAFCYAYKLYRLKEFRKVFKVEGHFFRTYPINDRYKADPWSPDYVNPDGDHYAQKHPDEDFAETFATFIDPTESWKERYRARNGAYEKIQFVKKAIKMYGARKIFIEDDPDNLHIPVSEIKETVAEFFHISPRRYIYNADGYVDPEIKTIFRQAGRLQKPTLPASHLITRYRVFIEKTVGQQTKLKDTKIIEDIIVKIHLRAKALNLVYIQEEEEKTLAMLTSLILLKTISFKMFGTFRLPVR